MTDETVRVIFRRAVDGYQEGDIADLPPTEADRRLGLGQVIVVQRSRSRPVHERGGSRNARTRET